MSHNVCWGCSQFTFTDSQNLTVGSFEPFKSFKMLNDKFSLQIVTESSRASGTCLKSVSMYLLCVGKCEEL